MYFHGTYMHAQVHLWKFFGRLTQSYAQYISRRSNQMTFTAIKHLTYSGVKCIYHNSRHPYVRDKTRHDKISVYPNTPGVLSLQHELGGEFSPRLLAICPQLCLLYWYLSKHTIDLLTFLWYFIYNITYESRMRSKYTRTRCRLYQSKVQIHLQITCGSEKESFRCHSCYRKVNINIPEHRKRCIIRPSWTFWKAIFVYNTFLKEMH